MSAIFGVVRFDGADVAPGTIDRMAQSQQHRGPHGTATVELGPVAMGHCLLRVNHEDWHEAQPIVDQGQVLVADLRLDNRDTLAETLGIAAGELATMPDSAVLLAAYRRWGGDCARHLLGDFAFAIWDTHRRELLLGRDHMGQRYLHFHHGDGFLAFATDVRALWAVEGVPHAIDEAELARRLMVTLDAVRFQTGWEGIALLPGATTMTFDASGAATASSYWEPHAGAAHQGCDDAYFIHAYRRTVEEAVACRVRRLIDPPALLFSGGVDSGSIAAFAGPIAAAKGQRVAAIASVRAEGEAGVKPDARAAVEAFRGWPGIDIRYFVRGNRHFFHDIERHFETHETAAGMHVVRSELFRLGREAGARIALDGHGGDYTVNVRAGWMLGRILREGHIVRFVREFRARRRRTGRTRLQILRHDVIPALQPMRALAALAAFRRRFRALWHDRCVNPAFAREAIAAGVVDPKRVRGFFLAHLRWQARWKHLLTNALTEVPPHAALAAAAGMDLTRPFHDKRVVELGLAIPNRLQFAKGLERHLARTALADLLPERLLQRGPGNDAEQPDLFPMMIEAAPGALAELRAMDGDGKVSRFIDLPAIEKLIAGVRPEQLQSHWELNIAMHSIALARYAAWFERSNG